jgi:thymidine phosphorylase
MIPQEIIRKKRDGHPLNANEIEFMITGLVSGHVPDYQMASLLMAIFLQGMSTEETAALLKAMIDSGQSYQWPKPLKNSFYVDKHSTGGVGDKTSLLILPLLLCDGLKVPMIAGRGLGHTGGTLDKLESLPGFQTQVPADVYRSWVLDLGGAFGAQTADFVPADKKIYALRDVTSTVESIPLIVASIMSKKLAEGLDALVLDVKFGSGSFMGSLENARLLAQRLVDTGRAAGCTVSAALTNMNEPLGRSAGNALEVLECLQILTNDQSHQSPDTVELTLALCARLSCDVRKETSVKEFDAAKKRFQEHLQSGRAFESFVQIAKTQGAQEDDLLLKNRAWVSSGAKEFALFPKHSGYLNKTNTRQLGLAILELGGGRKKVEDVIHPGVGLSHIKKRGEEVGPHEPLCKVHAASEAHFERMKDFLLECFEVAAQGEATTPVEPLIQEWI